MKITVYECDICGKRYEYDAKNTAVKHAGEVGIGRYRLDVADAYYDPRTPVTGQISPKLEDDMDICPACREAFGKFVDELKGKSGDK